MQVVEDYLVEVYRTANAELWLSHLPTLSTPVAQECRHSARRAFWESLIHGERGSNSKSDRGGAFELPSCNADGSACAYATFQVCPARALLRAWRAVIPHGVARVWQGDEGYEGYADGVGVVGLGMISATGELCVHGRI